jgi:lipoprotein-releasing system permease protein
MPGTAARIALRYLRGRRGANAAPLLSRISMLALAVGSAAMLVLFSVFNGFESVIGDLYTAFYPEMRISAARGKFFTLPESKLQQLGHLRGVDRITPVIEDNVFVNMESEQVVVTLKGVNNDYFQVNKLKPYIIAGRDTLRNDDRPTAIAGLGIASRLGLSVNNDFNPISLYYPNADAGNGALDPMNALSSLELRPDGIFQVQEEFDQRYILAPLPLVQDLFNETGRWSALELRLKPGADPVAVQRELRKALQDADGKSAFVVQTRFEQNRSLNTVMRTEKWATYVILLFVLLIASVNMIGAMSLLVLEKRRDMAILAAMGATRSTIRNVFLIEGLLWGVVGGGIGLLFGALLCLGQQHWGWVRLAEGFIIQSYPVALKAGDFAVIAVTVIGVGIIAAVYPAMQSGKRGVSMLN